MRPKLAAICTVVAMSLCLFACSSAPKQVSVDASDTGKEVAIAVGGSLTVTLESNPTTGFQWSELADISDQAVLEQPGHELEAPEATGIVGPPGKEIWTFKGLKKGRSTITMEYSRPWESDEKASESFSLTVIVK